MDQQRATYWDCTELRLTFFADDQISMRVHEPGDNPRTAPAFYLKYKPDHAEVEALRRAVEAFNREMERERAALPKAAE